MYLIYRYIRRFNITKVEIKFYLIKLRMSKNKGIQSYLTSQKLFKSPNNKYDKNSVLNSTSPKINTTPRSYHYHLLSQTEGTTRENQSDRAKMVQVNQKSKVQNRNYERNIDQSKNNQSDYLRPNHLYLDKNKGRISQLIRNSRNVENQRASSYEREDSFIGDEPLGQRQSPSAWESLVIKSSRKYFDSCRAEAVEFLQKLDDMLGQDKKFISSWIQKIDLESEETFQKMSKSLKQKMYELVCLSINEWKKIQIQKFRAVEINYIGEIFELKTQIEERGKQLEAFRRDLDNQKNWKIRASDLLTSNYQTNLVQLSKLCRKSTYQVEQNLYAYWAQSSNYYLSKFEEPYYIESVKSKICQFLSDSQDQTNQQLKKQRIENLKTILKPMVGQKESEKNKQKGNKMVQSKLYSERQGKGHYFEKEEPLHSFNKS